MLMEVLAISGIGTVAYSLLDHENMLPWSAMANGTKKWWWEKQPFVQPPPTVRAPLRPALTTEQQHALKVQQQQAEELAEARRQSKYTISGQPSVQPFNQKPLGSYKSV